MQDKWSRRSFLKLTGAGLAATAISGTALRGGQSLVLAADEFDTLRSKWKELLTGGEFDATDPLYAPRVEAIDQRAQEYWDSMNKSASRTTLWSDLAIPTSGGRLQSAAVNSNYSRLYSMALAYATNGTSQFGNGKLAGDIAGALDLLYERVYNENQQEFGNWWHWEIGIPKILDNICVLIYEHLFAGWQPSNGCRVAAVRQGGSGLYRDHAPRRGLLLTGCPV